MVIGHLLHGRRLRLKHCDACLSINNDFSFDEEIGDAFGCKVLAFDPSMKKGTCKTKFEAKRI